MFDNQDEEYLKIVVEGSVIGGCNIGGGGNTNNGDSSSQ